MSFGEPPPTRSSPASIFSSTRVISDLSRSRTFRSCCGGPETTLAEHPASTAIPSISSIGRIMAAPVCPIRRYPPERSVYLTGRTAPRGRGGASACHGGRSGRFGQSGNCFRVRGSALNPIGRLIRSRNLAAEHGHRQIRRDHVGERAIHDHVVPLAGEFQNEGDLLAGSTCEEPLHGLVPTIASYPHLRPEPVVCGNEEAGLIP